MNSFNNFKQPEQQYQPQQTQAVMGQMQGQVSVDTYNESLYGAQGIGGYNPNAEAQYHNNNINNFNINQHHQTVPNADAQFYNQMNSFNSVRDFVPGNNSIPNMERAQYAQSDTRGLMQMVESIDPDAAHASILGNTGGNDFGLDPNDPNYGYNKSVMFIRETLNAIENTEYWIPEKYASKAPAFNKLGAQLSKALKVYLERISVLGQ